MKGDLMSVQDVLRQVNKTFGDGSLWRLGEKPQVHVSAIPTGALVLDEAIGVGGIPRGRLIEVAGAEGCGKTTLALHICKEAQNMGIDCGYVDVEHAFDIDYAKAIGVDTDKLLFAQPDYGEQALQIAIALVESGDIGFVVIDSVAALTPLCELEGTMEDQQIGSQPRMVNKFLRKVTGILSDKQATILLINQVREKVASNPHSDPITTPGGRGIRHYTSVRIRMTKLDTEADKSGNNVRCRIVKNKVGVPLKQAEFGIIYGKGIDSLGCIVDVAIDKGIIDKAGGWYKYGENKWQGKEKVKLALAENEELQNEIKQRIK